MLVAKVNRKCKDIDVSTQQRSINVAMTLSSGNYLDKSCSDLISAVFVLTLCRHCIYTISLIKIKKKLKKKKKKNRKWGPQINNRQHKDFVKVTFSVWLLRMIFFFFGHVKLFLTFHLFMF